jgi:enoyl-CoA hydratase
LHELIAILHNSPFHSSEQVRAAVLHFCTAFSHEIVPQASELSQRRSAIDSAFSHDNLAQICAALTAQNTDFAHASLAAMQAASPLMVHTTLAALRRSRNTPLGEALMMERRLMRRCFSNGEPVEGIRALVVDKDHSPKWAHSHLDAVTTGEVATLFE